MSSKYKGMNNYQPQTQTDIQKTVTMIEGSLKVLLRYSNPPEGLVNNLLLRLTQYKALLPQKKKAITERKSILFPNSTIYV